MPIHKDPNFPPNLNIAPLYLAGSDDAHAQAAAIEKYGIAGRVWEASGALLAYLTPGGAFNPPCSIFTTPGKLRILELGSGQALASLHLAAHLKPEDLVVLTDLPEVVPLCNQSIEAYANLKAEVVARPLAWGEGLAGLGGLTGWSHILMCDLVYFPHLYPPLLKTLLDLTEPEGETLPDTDVFGPEIILAWKSRSLNLEESFFDAFAHYFRMEPVLGVADDEVKLFLCRRWRVTPEWKVPDLQHVMNGAPGVVKGRSYDLVDSLFTAIEWD